MKRIILIPFILFFITTLYSQRITKSVNFNNIILNGIAVDDNYFYFVGKYDQPGSAKLSEGYIGCMTHDLNTVWTKTLGSSLVDEFKDITLAGNRIFAVGIAWREKQYNQKSDLWFAIFSRKGELINEFYLGDSQQDAGYKIITTSDGNLLIVGYYSNNPGNQDLWLIKVDTNGNEIWSKTYGLPSKIEWGLNACQLTDGYLILGKELVKGKKDTDPYYLKIDNQGNLLWQQTQQIFEDNYFHSCINTGNLLLVGNTAQNVRTKKSDILIQAIDRNSGTQLMQKQLGTAQREWSYKAVLSHDKVYIFGVTSHSNKGTVWITDKSGNLQTQTVLPVAPIFDAADYGTGFVIVGAINKKGFIAKMTY